MPNAVPVQDVFALGVPDEWREQAEIAATTGEIPQELGAELKRLADITIYQQYRGRGDLVALLIGKHDFLITGDPSEVERFQPGDGCPACVAGNDQALATLRQNPGMLLALGNLNYTEVWRDQ